MPRSYSGTKARLSATAYDTVNRATELVAGPSSRHGIVLDVVSGEVKVEKQLRGFDESAILLFMSAVPGRNRYGEAPGAGTAAS